MTKLQGIGIAGTAFLIVLMLATVARVSQLALIQFICPAGMVITLAICVFIYVRQKYFSTIGVVGIYLVEFGFLWLMSHKLWESWAYGGGDAEWTGIAVSSLQKMLPKPIAIHPFVFEQPFIMCWYLAGIGLISYGGYLMFKGRR